jgi:hypothetical protein
MVSVPQLLVALILGAHQSALCAKQFKAASGTSLAFPGRVPALDSGVFFAGEHVSREFAFKVCKCSRTLTRRYCVHRFVLARSAVVLLTRKMGLAKPDRDCSAE